MFFQNVKLLRNKICLRHIKDNFTNTNYVLLAIIIEKIIRNAAEIVKSAAPDIPDPDKKEL